MTIEGIVADSIKWYFLLVAICFAFAFIPWLVIRFLFPKRDQSLSEDDKSVVHYNFDKGSKNRVGYLEITNDALSFRSIDKAESIVISLSQITRTMLECAAFSSVAYSTWSNWPHYLWIYYRPDTASAEKNIVFTFQRKAGVYAVEIKTKINSMLQSRGVTVDRDEEKGGYLKTKKHITREAQISLSIYFILFWPALILGQFVFINILPFNLIEINPIRLALLTIYLFSVYWIIRFVVRFIVSAVKKVPPRV